MAIKRESSCPLCGAKMTAEQLLDACAGIADARLGVLEARCPFCQGYLEVMPMPDRIDVGYLASVGAPRFDVVLALPYPGLVAERTESGLRISAPGRLWTFTD
jgi:hypothetical protein